MKKYGKKRVFSSQYFIEYLPSISASENPMVGFSAIKNAQKSTQWIFDMLFNIKFYFFWCQFTEIYSGFGYFLP